MMTINRSRLRVSKIHGSRLRVWKIHGSRLRVRKIHRSILRVWKINGSRLRVWKIHRSILRDRLSMQKNNKNRGRDEEELEKENETSCCLEKFTHKVDNGILSVGPLSILIIIVIISSWISNVCLSSKQQRGALNVFCVKPFVIQEIGRSCRQKRVFTLKIKSNGYG